MFAVTGITGNVGGEVARKLLDAGQPVRGVVRDTRKGETWATRGCDLAEADINDMASTKAGLNSRAENLALEKEKWSCEPCFNGLSNAKAGLERSRAISPKSIIATRPGSCEPTATEFPGCWRPVKIGQAKRGRDLRRGNEYQPARLAFKGGMPFEYE
jgi:hypothetical protein